MKQRARLSGKIAGRSRSTCTLLTRLGVLTVALIAAVQLATVAVAARFWRPLPPSPCLWQGEEEK